MDGEHKSEVIFHGGLDNNSLLFISPSTCYKVGPMSLLRFDARFVMTESTRTLFAMGVPGSNRIMIHKQRQRLQAVASGCPERGSKQNPLSCAY